MRMFTGILLASLCLFWFTAPLRAQTAPATSPVNADPALQDIAELRAGLLDAFVKKDVDKMLAYLHPDVIVTWQNGEVSHGREEVRQYYTRMMVGDNRVCESVTASPIVEGRALIGDTSISYGRMNDTFKLKDGMEFTLDSRFSAWLVRENGHWLVRGFHLSGNIFDNQVQSMMVKKTTMWTGIGAGVIGLVLGFGIARVIGRKPAAGKVA